MNELKIYMCRRCGNLIVLIKDAGITPKCCGENMQKIEANTTDASQEKHVPKPVQDGYLVYIRVGERPHPMNQEHYIEWIVLLTDQGVYAKRLKPLDIPLAAFSLNKGEIARTAYAYCNLHGLWKKDV